MQVEKISTSEATITFSYKEIALFRRVINETANGLHLDAGQKRRLGKTSESANDFWEELYRVFSEK